MPVYSVPSTLHFPALASCWSRHMIRFRCWRSSRNARRANSKSVIGNEVPRHGNYKSSGALMVNNPRDAEPGEAELAETGLAGTGLAETGLAETRLAETGSSTKGDRRVNLTSMWLRAVCIVLAALCLLAGLAAALLLLDIPPLASGHLPA